MSDNLKSFLWRVWNTVKYPLATICIGLFTKIVKDIADAQTLSVLNNLQYWDSIAVTFLTLISGVLGVGTMAGADKVFRIKE